jgi:hypothetical protein
LSLVVAEATTSGPRIVADTHVTFGDMTRSSYKRGTLKAITISRDVTICFAGDVLAGLGAVRSFAAAVRGGSSVGELVPTLQALSSDGRRPVEFIVATRDDLPLTRIRGGLVEADLRFAWIGEQQAFERFQEVRLQPHLRLGPIPERMMPAALQLSALIEGTMTPPERTSSVLQTSMQAVINDPSVPSVAGFVTAIAHTAKGFEYLGSLFIYVGRDIVVTPGEDIISRMAQPVEDGGFAVSMAEPAEPGTPALGLSFPRARLGMIYLPLEFDEAQVITDVGPNEFPSAVFERFGVRMKLPGLVATG